MAIFDPPLSADDAAHLADYVASAVDDAVHADDVGAMAKPPAGPPAVAVGWQQLMNAWKSLIDGLNIINPLGSPPPPAPGAPGGDGGYPA